MKKRIIVFCSIVIILSILISLIAWIAWENKAIELNTYTVTSERLPSAFDGFKIAQISDLHNTEIGDDNEKLILLLEQAEPDIIVITGDMIDSRRTDVDVALSFAAKAMKIAPCYYVTGNHESRVTEYIALKAGLLALGVNVLENSKTKIELEGQHITLVGINDPNFFHNYRTVGNEIVIDEILEELMIGEEGFTVLLSHRPELFDVYEENNVDLAFCGHAHGGQIRLPLVGGIFAPNQDFFPEYDGGLYTQNNANMLVSRGIGNSRFPFRVNNRPEIILAVLDSNSDA